jgi:hypothetical protein
VVVGAPITVLPGKTTGNDESECMVASATLQAIRARYVHECGPKLNITIDDASRIMIAESMKFLSEIQEIMDVAELAKLTIKRVSGLCL